MKRVITPARKFGGVVSVPGDKSIGHRAALLSILAREPIIARNFPTGTDCDQSLRAAEAMGVKITRDNATVTLSPQGQSARDRSVEIDCGNSGTTARLLTGISAGLKGQVTLKGDASLSARPMKRIIDPLSEMGANIESEDGRLPLTVAGKKLLPLDYRLPVPSAQVKSALLMAGLASGTSVTIKETTLSRDHTELMLANIGDGISIRTIKPELVVDPVDPRKRKMLMPESFKREITLGSQACVRGGEIDIPGDFSTAIFLLAVGAISGKKVTVTNVGLNPTRTGFLSHLKAIGCTIEISEKRTVSGELRGTAMVVGGELKARKIDGEVTTGMIDELPMVAVLAAFAEGTTVIRGASELRVKESDRIEATADNLRLMGVKVGVLEDGLAVDGRSALGAADFKSFGDHRIAMAFAVAALFLDGPSSIDDAEIVNISCPEFYELLSKVAT